MKRLLLPLVALVIACSSSSSDDGATGAPPPGGPTNNNGTGNGDGSGTSTGGGSTPPNQQQPGTTTPSTNSRAGCKRGVAYGYHSEADMRVLSPGVSWWYNWAFEPDAKVKTTFASIGFEYVPMVWGTKVDVNKVDAAVLPGAKTLLGYNEPNFFEQANMSAANAAAGWPAVQKVAETHGLTLVSPAVNFCGGGCHDTNPFDYLEDFFAACPGCKVDALGVHIYVGCKGENGNHAQWMINHLKTYEARFTQPIWLTEFACSDAKNPEEQRLFLVDAVKYLESDPRIARYAWFAGRANNVPHVDLLGADGTLTALGKAYVEAPRDPACQIH